jgi:hypothetical protein
MPFPKEAARRGGRHPNSDRQKAIARETIKKVKPWQKSTGPKSAIGKIVARYNSLQLGAYSRFVKGSGEAFETECLEVEQAIAMLERDCITHRENYNLFKPRRFSGLQEDTRWLLVSVDIW